MIEHFTDHAANERTWLAWLRTALSIMAFGFLIERVDLFVQHALAASKEADPEAEATAIAYAGMGLVVLGVVLLGLATRRFRARTRSLCSTTLEDPGRVLDSRIIMVVIGLLGLLLVGFIMQRLVHGGP